MNILATVFLIIGIIGILAAIWGLWMTKKLKGTVK